MKNVMNTPATKEEIDKLKGKIDNLRAYLIGSLFVISVVLGMILSKLGKIADALIQAGT